MGRARSFLGSSSVSYKVDSFSVFGFMGLSLSLSEKVLGQMDLVLNP